MPGRDGQDSRFYRRYAFGFEGPEFPLAVYLNWWAQRVHHGKIGVTVGKRSREMKRQKAYFDEPFIYLDDSMKSGSPVECRVDADLAVALNWEAGRTEDGLSTP